MAESTEQQERLDSEISRASAFMTTAQNIVFFTGAGASAESGIQTFRGSSGLWQRFPPETYGTITGIAKVAVFTPWNFAAFLREVIGSFVSAKPNSGHTAVSNFENNHGMKTVTVITQNVDGLHQEAGSKRVLELHGSLLRWSCWSCLTEREFSKSDLVSETRELLKDGWVVTRFLFGRNLPRCQKCNGILRPNVVLFGESLPQDVLSRATGVCQDANCVVVVGTSGSVQPASLLPRIAKDNGATIIEINPTNEFTYADVWLQGKATDVLPLLVGSTLQRVGIFDIAIELAEKRQQRAPTTTTNTESSSSSSSVPPTSSSPPPPQNIDTKTNNT